MGANEIKSIVHRRMHRYFPSDSSVLALAERYHLAIRSGETPRRKAPQLTGDRCSDHPVHAGLKFVFPVDYFRFDAERSRSFIQLARCPFDLSQENMIIQRIDAQFDRLAKFHKGSGGFGYVEHDAKPIDAVECEQRFSHGRCCGQNEIARVDTAI